MEVPLWMAPEVAINESMLSWFGILTGYQNEKFI